MARALALTAGVLAASLTGCSPFGSGGTFNCAMHEQCNAGINGRCEPTGHCSYADSDCPGGQRYGDNAGTDSKQCVGQQPGGDGGPDSSGNEYCAGSTNGLVKPCFASQPTGTKTLTDPYDTDVASNCEAVLRGADGLCVVSAATINVNTTVHVKGSKPLVLVATGAIDITGKLDAASHRGATAPYTTAFVGAGANPTAAGACNAGDVPTNGGGGAGGTLTASGGNGGDSATGGGNDGGVAGTAPTSIATLRGGCRAQDGHNGTVGQGGNGGGALYLIAMSINIAGTGEINASGEAGHPGVSGGAGGGGGGSGGMIVLDAMTIANIGVVYANGGGGAEGSGNTTPGAPGNEPTGAAAAGASLDISNGGSGGAGGAAGATGGGTGQNVNGFGGGGGGGGVGLIKTFGSGALTGNVSPAPS